MKKIKNEIGLYVALQEGENIESLLKRFKRKIKNSNLLTDLIEKKFYEKPTDKKRKARKLSKLRKQKASNINNI